MATIDDFESYSTGDLNGQGGYSGSTLFDVSTASPEGGSQHVRIVGTTTAFATCVKSYSGALTGTITFKYQVSSTNARTYFVINNGSNAITYIGIRNNALTAYHSGGEYSFGAQSLNTYLTIDYEWGSTTFRVRVNGGSWSTTLSPFAGSSAVPTSLGPCNFSNPVGNSDWDTITDDVAAGIVVPQFLGYAGL